MNEEQDLEKTLPFYLADIESFERNPVWKEILVTVKERIHINNNELRTKTDLNSLLRAQGDMVACEFFLVQTELLKEAVEEQQEDTEESEDDK